VILFKKAFRAIWESKRVYAACMVLTSVGILIFVTMSISTNALIVARDNYYRQSRLADVFASVKAIPKTSVEKLRSVTGISDVLARLVVDARVIMSGSDKIISLRLVTIDPDLHATLNTVSYAGTMFRDDRDIMIGNDFFAAHHLKLGDTIRLIVYGREQDFTVCASAQSPEYVYTVKEGESLPDPETFDVAFVQEKTLFTLTNYKDTYNDLCFQLAPGFTFGNMRAVLEDKLERFGLLTLTAQKDQTSCSMMDAKIEGNLKIGRTIPFIFVLMAVIVLSIMLKRVIEQDRIQIGTLKAFGYSNGMIVGHYLVYGAITGISGGIMGCIIGYYVSGKLIGLNAAMYNLPHLVRANVTDIMTSAMCIAVVSGLAGAFAGARNVLQLSPAEAMRPSAPPAVKNRVSKFHFIGALLLNSRGNMAIRGILRNKTRSLFIIMGMMFSFALLTLIGSYLSLIDDMLMTQFTKIQLYNGKISLVLPVRYTDALSNIRKLRGVSLAEGMLEMPAELKHNHLSKDTAITGLESDSALYKIHDDGRNTDLKIARDSIVLSSKLAENLEVKPGDTVYISSYMLKDDVKLIVSDVADMSMGQTCYMNAKDLERIFDLSDEVTSVILKADDMNVIRNYFAEASNVSAIQDKDTIIANNRKLMESVSSALFFLEIMAIAVAFAIIYNTSSISLSERKREYSTLRVLGLTVNEVAEILHFESWTLCSAGMIFGIPFANFLSASLSRAINMDLFTFPSHIHFYAYISALIGCITAVFLSNRSAVRNIRRFDMVEVLKDRE